MWIPHRNFYAFHHQCKEKIDGIETFINAHLELLKELPVKELDYLRFFIKAPEQQRQCLELAWTKHLPDVQEWGLVKRTA